MTSWGGIGMTDRKVLLLGVTIIAVVLAIAASSCARRGVKPQTFKQQYDKVTPGMTYEDLLRLVGNYGMPVENDPNRIMSWAVPQPDGTIHKGTFHMENRKVVSKEFEVVEPPAQEPPSGGAPAG